MYINTYAHMKRANTYLIGPIITQKSFMINRGRLALAADGGSKWAIAVQAPRAECKVPAGGEWHLTPRIIPF